MSENAPPPKARTVLVVDDESTVRMTLVYCLELGGLTVLSADSGEAAAGLFAAHIVNVALIDLHMPRINGFQCASTLQALAKQRGRPLAIWFMTGCPTSADRARAAAMGVRDVLRKPFDFAALLREIARALEPG